MRHNPWLGPKRRSGPIDAVHDLFLGEERLLRYPAISPDEKPTFHGSLPAATGNRLRLPHRGILENLRAVQSREGIMPSTALSRLDFALTLSPWHERFETYLHTIHDLSTFFTFDHFIILAASALDRERLRREYDSLRSKLNGQYSGPVVTVETYRHRVQQIFHFSLGIGAQVLVMAPGSLVPNRRSKLFRPHERLWPDPPVSLIRFTRPIVLVDERRVGGAKAYRGAAEQLSPLCVFRYFTKPAEADH